MQAGVLITNGGPHPADKWAEVSADQIVALIDIDDRADSPQATEARRAKRRFREDLIDTLTGHHDDCIGKERGALKTHGVARYDQSEVVDDHHPETLEAACQAVSDAASKYPVLGNHFSEGEAADVVRRILRSHMNHIMHIERGWHRDLGGKVFGEHLPQAQQQIAPGGNGVGQAPQGTA